MFGSLRLGRKVSTSWPPARLGVLERWYAAQPVPRVAGFVLELPRPVEEHASTRALEVLRARHPDALATTLRTNRGVPTFAPCTVVLPLTRAPTGDLWTSAAQDLHAPFRAGGPLWRLNVMDSGTCLIATFHHVIADGVSVSIFARELLALLRGEPLANPPVPRRPLDACLDLRPSLKLLAHELRAGHPEAGFYRGPDHEVGLRHTQLIPCTLSEPLVAALAARVRREGATVHAALCAAGLVAIASHARTDANAAPNPGLPLHVRLMTPISLRAYATPRPTGMGVYLCGLENDYQLEGTCPFWRLAEDYTRRVRAAVPESYQRLGLLRFAGNLERRAEQLSQRPNARTATLEVSNLGRVEGLAGARFWFMQGNHYHGPLFNLSVATCAESGVLRATLAIPVPVVDARQGADFARFFERVIAEVAERDLTLQEALEGASG